MHMLTQDWAQALRAQGWTSQQLADRRRASAPRVLLVLDPGYDLGRNGPWALGRMLDVLRVGAPLALPPVLHLASRAETLPAAYDSEGRPWAVRTGFDFAANDGLLDIERIDQVWLFAGPQGQPLRADEVDALRRFMDAGGGVLACGHGAGLPLLRSVPRVADLHAGWEALPGAEAARPASAGRMPARARFQSVWAPSGHALLSHEPRALGPAWADAEPGVKDLDELPRPHVPVRASGARRPCAHALAEADWPQAGLGAARTVARLAQPWGCAEDQGMPLIRVFDGREADGQGYGRILCDVSASHFIEVDPRARACRPHGGSASRPASPGHDQASALLLNALHWLMPQARAAEQFWWDLVCLRFHPKLTERLPLIEVMAPARRDAAYQELGEHLLEDWQRWHGHYVQSWMQCLGAAAGSGPEREMNCAQLLALALAGLCTREAAAWLVPMPASREAVASTPALPGRPEDWLTRLVATAGLELTPVRAHPDKRGTPRSARAAGAWLPGLWGRTLGLAFGQRGGALAAGMARH